MATLTATWGEQLVTTAQAAELAQRAPATIRSWAERGWLTPAQRRRGGVVLVIRDIRAARAVLDPNRVGPLKARWRALLVRLRIHRVRHVHATDSATLTATASAAVGGGYSRVGQDANAQLDEVFRRLGVLDADVEAVRQQACELREQLGDSERRLDARITTVDEKHSQLVVSGLSVRAVSTWSLVAGVVLATWANEIAGLTPWG